MHGTRGTPSCTGHNRLLSPPKRILKILFILSKNIFSHLARCEKMFQVISRAVWVMSSFGFGVDEPLFLPCEDIMDSCCHADGIVFPPALFLFLPCDSLGALFYLWQ